MHPRTASADATMVNQRFISISSFLRSTISASAPAGRVKIRKGREATVDISEIKKGDAVSVLITQVAAVSWAATQVPETRFAIHNFLKVGLRNALQVEAVAVVINNPAVRGGLWLPPVVPKNGM